MGRQDVAVGAELPPVVKHVTQAKINLFETMYDRKLMGLTSVNQHTSVEVAKRRIGTSFTIASGRMEFTYACEVLRRSFGPEAFAHTGHVYIHHVRPVRDGDTITVKGTISKVEPEVGGRRVTVDLTCVNQHGDMTGVGTGTVLVS